ncbi:phospholipase A1 member A-like isoform X1 [Petromyzon marinus]|uniref:phospholipase A1 member A-like isoform X1 n=2 Tax=Petromyzon marinus TaxID=7757 RepID=UPI003F6E955E
MLHQLIGSETSRGSKGEISARVNNNCVEKKQDTVSPSRQCARLGHTACRDGVSSNRAQCVIRSRARAATCTFVCASPPPTHAGARFHHTVMAKNWVVAMVQVALICMAERARATSICPHFQRATLSEMVRGHAKPHVRHVIFTARNHRDPGDPSELSRDPDPEPDEFASWKVEPTTAPSVRCRFYLLPSYDSDTDQDAGAAAAAAATAADGDDGEAGGGGGGAGAGGSPDPTDPGDEEARRKRILLLKEHLARAGFNASLPTTILIHGYRVSGTEPDWIEEIAAAVLEASQGRMNVIAVDWIKGASSSYSRAVRYARTAAAAATAALVRDLTTPEVGAREQSLHLVGVSLGAHLAGFVGQSFQGRLGRITALDPASPGFSQVGPAERLDPSDAAFVDAIHTDGDNFGLRQPVGHVDFYVNGGDDQPGCGGFGYQSMICDHMRAVRLWLSSLRSPCELRAFPCDSVAALAAGRCLECRTERTASCPRLGLHSVDAVRDPKTWPDNSTLTLHMLTGHSPPYCVSYMLVEMDTAGEAIKGSLTIKFMGQTRETAEMALFQSLHNFVPERGGTSRVLALERDLGPLRFVALRFSPSSLAWNFLRFAAPRASHAASTLRIARLRITHLLVEHGEQFCLYMVLLSEGQVVGMPLSRCQN